MHTGCLIRPSPSILLHSPSMPYVCIYPFHLYVPPISTICPYPRSTHSSTSNYIVFVSINYLRAFEDFVFDFVIASAGFELPLIHLTSAISLRSYACRRHIMSIINRFSCVVPSFTRQSYNNLESVQRTSGKSIPSILSIVNLTKAPISKPWAIPYSFKARTLLVTLLHFVDD